MAASSGKVHYYKSRDGRKKRPIPKDLIEGIVDHSESHRLNIMQTSLFNFENTDQINLEDCLIDVSLSLRVNEREADELVKDQIFREHRGSKAPKVVVIEGRPGTGKSTYFRNLAYTLSSDFLECHGKGPSQECEGHEWILVLYIAADSMNTPDMKKLMKNALMCKPKDQEKLIGYILKGGKGVLVGCDAVDEIHNENVKSELDSFIKKVKKGNLKLRLLLTTRTELPIIKEKHIDRKLTHEGFTYSQGVKYVGRYFEKVHGKQEPNIDAHTYRSNEGSRLILMNPLMAHILSELVASEKRALHELLTGTPIQLLRSLEKHLTRRGIEGGNLNTESLSLYQLCLQCLIQGIRQIPESMLKDFSIPLDSLYLGFMNRHPNTTGEAYYTFVHEVIFEYFAAAGLISYLNNASIQDEAKKAVTLSVSADPRMRTVLEMTCGLIAKFNTNLESYITSIVRANIILQHPQNDCQPTEITKSLFKLPSMTKDITRGIVPSTEFGAEQSTRALEVWQKIQDAFEVYGNELKEAGWMTSLHDKNDPPNLESDMEIGVEELVSTLQTKLTTEKMLPILASVRKNFLHESAFKEEPLKSIAKGIKMFLTVHKGPKVAKNIMRNLIKDDPSDMKLEYLEEVIKLLRKVDTKSLVNHLKPLKSYLENWSSTNVLQNVSPVLSHTSRCLNQSMSAEQEHRLFEQTINCLLPSSGDIGGNMVTMIPVSGCRWALLWEDEENSPHVYSTCPADMAQALKQHKMERRQTTPLAVLYFVVKGNECWGNVDSGWTKESAEATLRELHNKYGQVQVLTILTRTEQSVHYFTDCLQGAASVIPPPKILIFSSGIQKLQNLRQLIESCAKVPTMILLCGSWIVIDRGMSKEEVSQELVQKILGIMINPVYLFEDEVDSYNWDFVHNADNE